MLKAIGISKAYGAVHALTDVSICAEPGEIVGLVGPNGAGKTTLVGVLTGQVRPDDGAVSVNGIDLLGSPRAAQRHVAAAAQEVGFYPTRRVADNLVHFARLLGLPRDAAAARAREVSAAMHLSHLARQRAADLSGGEKRRLHVAIALLAQAPVLFLDEPTANVDIDTRAAILDLVRAQSAEGVAIVYATHYLEEIETLGASVVMIDAGQVIASGSVDDLVRRHGTPLLEVTLARPLPEPVRVAGCAVDAEGLCLRIGYDSAEPPIPLVLEALGEHASGVQSIEVRRASLELAYLRLRRGSR